MNRKGLIRMIEVFISIMVISTVIVFLFVAQSRTQDPNDSVRDLQRFILQEIASKEDLRSAALNQDVQTINNSINIFIPSEINYDIKICDLNKICKLDQNIEKEIFSDEISISSNLSDYNPKVVKIFMWED